MKKVLVGGVFNILHPGHLFFLKEARKLGDCLIVVVAHDKNVEREKGYLIFNQKERCKLLRSIKFVDKVIEGRDDDKLKVVERERPDVIALGYDQKMDEKELRKRIRERRIDCKVVRIRKRYKGYSTISIIKKVKACGDMLRNI